MSPHADARGAATPSRTEGPCDIYAAGGAPCAAAHSTTRALYAAYNGPLYQVLRQSDGKTLDISVVQPSASPVPDAGGYANAAAQDAFCANTYCWITKIYDQSPRHNDLIQAPRGAFSGPAMGGYNNLPVADMAPATLMGHKVYGVFIAPGMGLRQNDVRGTAVDDQAEGQYWVINGKHYNSGCCFDYGNAETDSRDDGNGTMETTYYGNATPWYHGNPPGPWIMTDQENNLVGCVNSDGSKLCKDLPNIDWRFVTAMADGEPHHWRSMGANAQNGDLKIMFDGPRVNATYDPMRKQGAILLGNGGDNSNGSQGTFYEGAMTAGGTFPTRGTNDRIQANIVAAKYDVAPLSVARPGSTASPSGLQTFSPGSSQETTVTFTNTTGAPVTKLALSITGPAQWIFRQTAASIANTVAPGATASATFRVTSGPTGFNGDMVAVAKWNSNGAERTETAVSKVRNVSPVKINEFRVNGGLTTNQTNSFIELYNAGSKPVDISNWTLTQHQTQQAIFSSIQVPAGTKLATGGFYLLGLATSGLAVPASKGDSTIHLRSIEGLRVGNRVEIDTGAAAESRKIAAMGTAAGNATPVWQPLPEGPVITLPAGSTNVPVTSVAGIEVGQKIGIGYGATFPAVSVTMEKYEVVTVTELGKPGTQAYLTADAKAGTTNLKASSTANISVGDKIRLDIDSKGHGIETVTVARVGTQSARNAFRGPLQEQELGTGLELSAPLKFDHASNIPFSVRGTGITFQPATAFAHQSNEPVLPLGSGITLDQPLTKSHAIDTVVRDGVVTTAGYQGAPVPNQWFGGPALSNAAGSMVLRDASGLVVDSLNYGLIVDPWAAEGYHGKSGSNEGGCRVMSPSAGGRGGFGFGGPGAPAFNSPHRSAGRFPDGADSDSNCTDFHLQSATTIATDSAARANNLKVTSVADFEAGQKLLIDSGANQESAVISVVGTPGATVLRAEVGKGAMSIPVATSFGFSAGQAITIGSGDVQEKATISSINFGGRNSNGASLTVGAPLHSAHAAQTPVSGTGITLSAPLGKSHAAGTQINTDLPTPGTPNRYPRLVRR